MPSSSYNKYDFFNACLIFTPGVFIQCKKYGDQDRGAGDREFWSTFFNLRATS